MMLKPEITKTEIELINRIMTENPKWGRTKISLELCKIWEWNYHDGRPKGISCRDMLRRLDAKGIITLPLKQKIKPVTTIKKQLQIMLFDTNEKVCDIKEILPVKVLVTNERTNEGKEFKSLIDQYHYLGFDMTIGENLKYTIYSRQGRILACLLFGSSAWACAPRDNFIGWNPKQRKSNLIYTTNNTRFLVLPWIKIPHLASHILGLVARRISKDWSFKYGHSLHCLETFVEKDRFKGTCYKAANWKYLGETTGRSRNDRYTKLKVPIKDIYIYPLSKKFREELQNESHT